MFPPSSACTKLRGSDVRCSPGSRRAPCHPHCSNGTRRPRWLTPVTVSRGERRHGPRRSRTKGSSQSATEHPDDRTATPSLVSASGSASRTRSEMPHSRRVLAMATELLRYRPAPDFHNEWLQSIEELVAAAGISAAATYQRL
ncbi:hypothetical protein D1007_07436 [Hordeum vulgare]|nr:hypothetical protein D1007_07436 [Hordeum vulgare]